MSTINPIQNEQRCRNTHRHFPVLLRCHQQNQSSLCPTASWLPPRCFAPGYTQEGEDNMKMGELLHSGNSGTAPAEGQMAQEERTGGSAEFPFWFPRAGFPSLQDVLDHVQPLGPEVQLFSWHLFTGYPSLPSLPSTSRRACLRLQMNPFVFT